MQTVMINGGNLVRKELFGVQRYTYEILCELDKIVKEGMFELIVPNTERSFPFKNIKVTSLDYQIDKNKFSKALWNHRRFPSYVKKNKGMGVDLSLGLPLSGCKIVAIHDCIVERFPQNVKTSKEKLGRSFYLFRVKRVLKKCEAVITVSEYSKKDIEEFYHIPAEQIYIIPNAWQHYSKIECDYNILNKLQLEEKQYFFSLGSRYYHKNFKWVVEAARQNPQYRFVVTGSNKLNSSDSSLNSDQPSNIIFTGYLSDNEVKALMEKCKAFIQPSLYEGFGIPPMEAMSTGTRCIVSNASCLPEIYQKSVWYIDPTKYEPINMDEIMKSEIEDNSIVLNSYSWEKSARLFYELVMKIRK